jgi:tRNA (guanine10-N2)-dimethyltransferase
MVKCSASFLVETIFTSSGDLLTRYFVQLSGENPELAKAEIESLTRQLPFKTVITQRGRILIIQGENNPIEFLLERAALAHRGGIILGELTYDDSPTEKISEDCWKRNILSSDGFSVRTVCLDMQFDLKKRIEIERGLGDYIRNITGARVELNTPATTILVIITPERILVCKAIESRLRRLLRAREPGKKPFFHPSMMNSILARVMCNLAGVRPGSTVLDPFCGGGGILCEAAYIGATPVGLDLNWKLLGGARKNLDEITGKYDVVQADAQSPPLRTIDHIVTDPPYGRSSSTRGNESKRLFESLLNMAPSLLPSGVENMCVCGSTEIQLPDMIQAMGFDIGFDIKASVHSGLIREVVTVRL